GRSVRARQRASARRAARADERRPAASRSHPDRAARAVGRGRLDAVSRRAAIGDDLGPARGRNALSVDARAPILAAARRTPRKADADVHLAVRASELEGRGAGLGARSLGTGAVARAPHRAHAAPALVAVAIRVLGALVHPARVAVGAPYPRS